MKRTTKHCEISEAVRLNIFRRYYERKSNKETVKNICNEFNVSRNVPAKLYKQCIETGCISRLHCSGRPSVVESKSMQCKIIKLIRSNRKSSCRYLGYQLKVSHNTANILRKYLKFKKVKKVSRPILSTSHIEQRLDFAKTNLRKQRLRRAYLDEK